MQPQKNLRCYWAPSEIKEQSFKIIPVRKGKTAQDVFHDSAAVHRDGKELREDSTGRLNMSLNSDIPRDLRLFIFSDLKIVRILSKSQKQLSSRTFAAARTTILR